MSKERAFIQRQIDRLEQSIKETQRKIVKLKIENTLHCDTKQWYKEEEVKPLGKKEKILIGKVYYIENFRDEDTGKLIPVTRSKVVRKNGKWLIDNL